MCDCHPVDNPYQIKLHSPTSCFDEKEINDFCQLTLLPFLSSLHHRFLHTHLSNDNRFNKSYGNSSIFVFLSHYWTDPQNQCSHSCEIIDGENVMRNYPSVTMVEQVPCSICLVQFSRRKVQIYLDGILSLQLLFSFQGTQSEDSARLEMRLLRTSAHQQNQQTGKWNRIPFKMFLTLRKNSGAIDPSKNSGVVLVISNSLPQQTWYLLLLLAPMATLV